MEDFKTSLEKYRLRNIPPRIYYVPNFITEDEEEAIISRIYEAPKPKWTQLSNRRLQNWGGIPHPKGMIAEAIPGWLRRYVDLIDGLNLMDGNQPNHVLINEYLAGQGIMAHTDGPLFHPTVTTISCGSHTVVDFTQTDTELSEAERKSYSVLLQRRSLFIVQESMYNDHKHSIDETEWDSITENISNIEKCSDFKIGESYRRGTRLSLTIRHVPKTTKIKIKI